MMLRKCLIHLAVVVLAAGAAAGAAPPNPRLEAIALLPASAVGFFSVASLKALDGDLKHFARETGWQIGHGGQPALDLVTGRTGIAAGLDFDRPVCIGFLDPKRYHERYTVYVLPVADWDAVLKATQGEEMSAGLYALTGTAGPRFVLRRGSYAVVTSSIRTMDALMGAESLVGKLSAETLARVAGDGIHVVLGVRQIKEIYEPEIASWFRAASGQIYNTPEATAYADMMVTYMLGIANILDQTESVEASVRFGREGVSVDSAVRFVDGAGVSDFLKVQSAGSTPIPGVTDRPLTSAVTLRLDSKSRTDFILRATQFFLESAPRPEPLPESTRKSVYEGVEVFTRSLGEHMTFLSQPAAPGMGLSCDVTVLDVVDVDQFKRGVALMVSSWETLADQLDLYLKFVPGDDAEEVEGVPVMTYVPRLRFGIPARHVEFRQRLRTIYGPEGLIYRIAVVGQKAVITAGSDLDLFRRTVAALKAAGEPPPAPAIRRLETHLPAEQNVLVIVSLPLVFGDSLRRGGTAGDRIGTVVAGSEVVGIGLRADGATLRMNSYWPHEQIRLTRELILRAAPDLAEIPKSLFEPAPEGPPRPVRPGVAPAPGGLLLPGAPPKETSEKPWTDLFKPLFNVMPGAPPAVVPPETAPPAAMPPTPEGRPLPDLFKGLFGPKPMPPAPVPMPPPAPPKATPAPEAKPKEAATK